VEFISAIVASLSSKVQKFEYGVGSGHACAEIYERWQFFEMEFDGQPTVVLRVAKLIVEDPTFGQLMKEARSTTQGWPREAAAIFFRFHAMCVDGELVVRADLVALLKDIVDRILAPLEQTPVSVSWLPRTGSPMGALISQALVAWLSAWRAGSSTAALQSIVQRVGRASANCMENYKHDQRLLREAKQRILLEYLALSHVPIWGSQDADIIWQTFYGAPKAPTTSLLGWFTGTATSRKCSGQKRSL